MGTEGHVLQNDARDRSIRGRFSRAARSYHSAAEVQRAVARQLVSALDAEPPPERIIEIGCGTGVLTDLVLARFPAARLLAVDCAPGMVAEGERRFAGERRIEFRVADIRTFRPRQRVPLLVSSCSLHWVQPVTLAMRGVFACLGPGGTAAVAIMLDGTLRELHEVRRAVVPDKAPSGRLPTRTAVLRAVSEAGLELVDARRARIAECHATVEELLGSLHRRGVTGGPVSVGRTHLTRGELGRVMAEYRRRHGAGSEGVCASYEVFYLMTRRGHT